MTDRTDEPTHRVPEVEVREPRPSAHDEARVEARVEAFEEIESQSVFSILSAVKRQGAWQAADQIDVFALMGEAHLDFTQAELPDSGMVEIHVMAILGSIKVVVPEGAEVEIEGVPLLGSFEQKTPKRRKAREVLREWVTGQPREPDDADDEPPLFRITGFALLGNVDVDTR